MAGHSKWANIKHKKERADQRKGKEFSRLAKEIISAVKQGGSDPKTNQKLRAIIQKAKAANLPNDIIERNIKKASSLDQQDFVELLYELYGHGGVGILAVVMTDNKNRISSEMRIATNKCGGNVATPGSVSFNFEEKGVIQVESNQAIEDELFLLVSEAGAEDFSAEEEIYFITTTPEQLLTVKEAIEAKKIPVLSAQLAWIPKTTIVCSQEDKQANEKLIEWLENIDDVDQVFHNME